MKVIADNVMAATQRLVQQAMAGRWEEVPKTVQERRELLNSLSASASPQDQQWLGALQQAMAESDDAVAQIAALTQTSSATTTSASTATEGTATDASGASSSADVDNLMEMLQRSR